MLASRLKRMSKDSLIYGLGGALARSVGIIMLPIFLKTFAPVEYGIYGNIINASALFFVLINFGLDGAATILYFEDDQPESRRRLTSAWLGFNLMFGLPFTLLLVGTSGLLVNVLTKEPPPAATDWLTLAVVTLPFSLLSSTFAAILRLNFRPVAYLIVNWLATFLNLSVALVLVLGFNMGVQGALYGPLAGGIFGTVVGFWLTRHSYRLQSDWPLLGRMLRLSWPLLPAGMAVWVNNSYAAGIFLAQLGGAEADTQVAVFNAVLKVSAIVGVLMTAFQLAWVPYSLSIANQPDAKRTYAKFLTYYTIGFGGLACALGLFGREILTLIDFEGNGYANGYPILGLLTFAAIIAGGYYITAIGSNISRRTSNISLTTILAAASSILLNLALIPVLGIVGAAIASLVASLLQASFVGYLSQRHYPIPFEWVKVTAAIALGMMLMLLGQGIQLNAWWLNGLAKLGILLLYPVIIIGSGIITRREFGIVRGAVLRRIGRAA